MKKIGAINTYTLDEFIDEEFGIKGTPSRKAFDDEVEERIAQLERKNYHITMPVDVHKKIAEKASALGQTISYYITSIMERELQLA